MKEIEDILSNGIDLWQSGERADAGRHFRRALDLAEQSYGPDAPQIIEPLFWFSGSVAPPSSTDVSQISTSITLLQRALRIAEIHFGTDSVKLVRILSVIAINLKVIKKLEEANQYYLRALHISETTWGDSPGVRLLLASLIDVILEMGRPAEALPYAERALHLEEHRKDDLAPVGIGWACRALGRCLMGVGRNAEAALYLERCLTIFKARHPGKKTILEDEILGWLEELRKRP